MEVNIKKIFLILVYICSITNVFSTEFTLEELKELKKLNMISNEDYQIFLDELVGVKERDYFYKLKINNIEISNTYPAIYQEDKYYFPILSIFKLINFKSYTIKDDKLIALLGNSLRKIEIPLNSKNVIKEKEDYFLESNEFKEILLSDLYIDKNSYQISMRLGFETKDEISIYLNNLKDRIAAEKESKKLLFTGERSLFELGNLKINLQGNYTKTGEESSFENSWTSGFEYQGPLLYGEFTGAYDINNGDVGNLQLYYPEIYKGHSFDIENNANGKSRQWALTFKKERGFYDDGKNYIISENVPIGSKVELLYMGFPIDIQDAVDGVVTFDNSEIREDRRYTLKVYTAEGEIYTIDIDTASYYYQQNKDEVEYDISIKEDLNSNKYLIDTNLYYGLTNNFTVGLGYEFIPEEGDDTENEDLHYFRGEGIYTNYIYKFPYTVVLGAKSPAKKDRYSFDFSYDIAIKDFTLNYDRDEYGKYYDEKVKDSYSIAYNPFDFLQLSYDWSDTEYHRGESESDESANLNLSSGFDDILVTFDYSKYLESEDEYEVNMYYNGFKNFNIQFSNYWKEGWKELEHVVKFSNKDVFNLLDYTFEIGYSDKYKDRFTFSFTLDYDNWFRGEANISENGDQRFSAGIDRVIDLKNIRKPLESMDSSRVLVKAFLDKNNNGTMEEGEEPVEYVGVKIGSQEMNTDENGEALFFGVPNEIEYEVKTTIRNPSYTSGNTTCKVHGKQVGTIYAYIPIKPMVIIKGNFKISEALNLSEDEKKSIYENTLIKVIDKRGEILEYVSPNLDGTFEVHGLLPEDHILSIEYIGLDNKNREILRKVDLGYYDDEVNQFIIHLTKDRLTLIQKFFSKGGEYEKIIGSNDDDDTML